MREELGTRKELCTVQGLRGEDAVSNATLSQQRPLLSHKVVAEPGPRFESRAPHYNLLFFLDHDSHHHLRFDFDYRSMI